MSEECQGSIWRGCAGEEYGGVSEWTNKGYTLNVKPIRNGKCQTELWEQSPEVRKCRDDRSSGSEMTGDGDRRSGPEFGS